MEWIVDDKYSKYRIIETDTLLELKEHLKNARSNYLNVSGFGLLNQIPMEC